MDAPPGQGAHGVPVLHSLLCGISALALCTVLSAGERIVLDLPLPPAPAARSASPVASAPALEAALRAPRPGTEMAADSATPPDTVPAVEPAYRTVRLEVRRGGSLYELFVRHGLSRGDLVSIERGSRSLRKSLRRLRPGQAVTVTASPDGRVHRMRLERAGPKDLLIERRDGGAFAARKVADLPPPGKPRTTAAAASSVGAAARDEPSAADPDPAGLTGPAPRQQATQAPKASRPLTTAASDPARVAGPEAIAMTDGGVPSVQTVHRVTVRPGDSLYLIFARLGIPPTELANLMGSADEAQRLRRLIPGQSLMVGLDSGNRLSSLRVVLDETRALEIHRRADSFESRIHEVPLESRVTSATAVIENSLFLAGQREGLSDRVIMELVEIFGWDVDFALDVRAGDRFTVVFEELYKDGHKVRDGHILASEFVNRGRSVRAIRYVDDNGRAEYFSPEGLSMRKAFLRTPVNFSRISSRFTRGRMHPVLQRMRAHRGVDYAAPRGTPVKAAGDGRVVFAGRKGGYGKTVILKHGATYTTLYGHLSRLHRRARIGRRVEQGEIIGYVGSTGLATGPHLHYEFQVRGIHQDPLRVKLPKALPIDARYRDDFLRKSAPLVGQLDVLANTSVASND
jgi:murein DD-endopeptidase MepM/ murein hydrolase activator NlpD